MQLEGREFTWLILYLSYHLQLHTGLSTTQHTLEVSVLTLVHRALISKGTDVLLPTNAKHSIGATELEKRVQVSVPSLPSIHLPFTVELNLPHR